MSQQTTSGASGDSGVNKAKKTNDCNKIVSLLFSSLVRGVFEFFLDNLCIIYLLQVQLTYLKFNICVADVGLCR